MPGYYGVSVILDVHTYIAGKGAIICNLLNQELSTLVVWWLQAYAIHCMFHESDYMVLLVRETGSLGLYRRLSCLVKHGKLLEIQIQIYPLTISFYISSLFLCTYFQR